MCDAHAEIGVIQQAYDAGLTQGQDMTIVVRGRAVCDFCQASRNGLAVAAERAGLNRLVIVDTTGQSGKPITYVWTRGTTGLVKQ